MVQLRECLQVSNSIVFYLSMNLLFEIILTLIGSTTAIAQVGELQPIPQTAGAKICKENRGIFIFQRGKEACFDPRKGSINNMYSPAKDHIVEPKDDFDILTNKNIHMFSEENFREGLLTICNFTAHTLGVEANPMAIMFPKSEEFVSVRYNKCKQYSVHMLTIYPNIRAAPKSFKFKPSPAKPAKKSSEGAK